MTTISAARYIPREFYGLGDWAIDDHRLKAYGISLPGASRLHPSLIAEARAYMEEVLQSAADEEGESSNLGYCILHGGEVGTWLLIDWWAHGDIGCQKLALAEHGTTEFRPMDHRPLNACVWEQVVIAHERNAWVRQMMFAAPDAEAYLADRLLDGAY